MGKILELMPIATFIFLCVYVAVCLVNLYFAFNKNEKMRKITKPFCLVALFVALITWKPNLYLLLIGLICDLAGDILLIWKKKLKIFLIGSVVFFAGHICYIAQGLNLYGDKLSWIFNVVVAFCYILFNLLINQFAKRVTKHALIAFLGGLYVSILFLVLVCFIAGCAVGYTSFLLLAVLGMISFISSDAVIIYTKFVKKYERQEFLIMALYLLAQFMIVLGFGLTF